MSARLSLDAWDTLQARDFDEWQALAAASTSSQPFLLPGFVRAAVQWLTPDAPPFVMRIRDGSGALIGLTCVRPHRADFFVPLPHWRGYRHAHAFQSGWLAARDESTAVASAIGDELVRAGSRMRAMLMHNLAGDDPLTVALLDSGNRRVHWQPTRRFQRPVLRIRPGEPAITRVRASVLKDLRRRARRLQDAGELTTRILHGESADAAAAERHLLLENAGWKGDAGSSMHGSPNERAFFLDMAAQLARSGELVFVELLLGDTVIASTSNLISGGVISGFKTGWDPEYRASSPGRINETRLLDALPAHWPQLHAFDSQAQEDSYLADMLPDTQTMHSGVLVGGTARKHWLRTMRVLRPLAYRLGQDD